MSQQLPPNLRDDFPIDEVPEPIDVTEVVRRNVREIRRARKMTAQDLADELARLGSSLNRSGLANFESGRRPLSVTELFELAMALRCRLPSLLMVESRTQAVRVGDRLVDAESFEAWGWGAGGPPENLGDGVFVEMPRSLDVRLISAASKFAADLKWAANQAIEIADEVFESDSLDVAPRIHPSGD